MYGLSKKLKWAVLLGAFLSCSILLPTVPAQSPSATTNGQTAKPGAGSRYRPNQFPKRERDYYQFVWGVDSLSVKYAESGEMIRFSYRVLNADKAKTLNDKTAEPVLIDPQAGVKLVIPSLENIGTLRQTGTPEPGKEYWMVFSNKSNLVKPGDRVNVIIGSFHVDGLMVE